MMKQKEKKEKGKKYKGLRGEGDWWGGGGEGGGGGEEGKVVERSGDRELSFLKPAQETPR